MISPEQEALYVAHQKEPTPAHEKGPTRARDFSRVLIGSCSFQGAGS